MFPFKCATLPAHLILLGLLTEGNSEAPYEYYETFCSLLLLPASYVEILSEPYSQTSINGHETESHNYKKETGKIRVLYI
jgi:hypothetical protein